MSASRPLRYGLVALVLVAAGLVTAANLWKSSLKVRRVVVEGNRIAETGEILQLVRVQRGAQLHEIDLMAVRRDVLSHHFIKEAVVERDLPATLKITVTERVPLAIVNSSEILYLDDDGVVLPHSISKHLFDLPVLTGISPDLSVSPGMTIGNEDVREALAILATSKLVSNELYRLISEVQLRNGGDVVLYATEGGVPIIFGRGDIASKLVRLEAFWVSIVREQGFQSLQYVDLRFDDQVVARWNHNKG